MKKFGKMLFITVLSVFLAAGCTMKCEFGMNISADSDVGMKIIMAYDKEMVDSILSMSDNNAAQLVTDQTNTTTAAAITDEQRWAFVDSSISDTEFNGATKSRYEEEGYYGYVFSETFGKLDSVTGETAEKRAYVNGDTFDTDVLFTKNGSVYKSNIAIDKTDESFSQLTTYSTMGAMFDLSFSVTLPVVPTSHNADKVSDDGKTLYWDLTKAENIDFEFDMNSAEVPTTTENKENTEATTGTNVAAKEDQMNKMVYIGVAGLCVVVLAVVVIIITNNTKKGDASQVITDPTAMPTSTTPVTPVEPTVSTEPVTPVEQTAPVASETTPVDTVAAVDAVSQQVEPVVPVQSVEPVVTPVEPTVPTEPVTPVAPVMPEANPMNVNPTGTVVPNNSVESTVDTNNFYQ